MSILDEEGQRTVAPRFLDLSGVHFSTKEELQNIMFKMLEVRLRPDKLSDEEIESIVYCESSSSSAEYPFLNPIPASMRDVNLSDLSQVDIDWKMLTLARPNTKQELEIFTRFVELEKLKVKSLCQEDAKAETRVTAIKIKVQADGFEQETNSDEFTYDYFSRRLAAEEVPSSEDSAKKPSEAEKRKLSEKLDSVTRQETFPEPAESPSPIPEVEPELKGKLNVKKKKKTKKLRKKKTKRRKRKRRIKRLKNGRIVFITVKRKKRYSLKKKKRKDNTAKKVSGSKEPTESVIKTPMPESTTGKEENISKEIIDSEDMSGTKNTEIRMRSARLRKAGKNKRSAPRKPSSVAEKTRKNNLSNASKTEVGSPKSGTVGRRINISKHVKGASSRVHAKRGTYARSTSIRLTKTAKVSRLKITKAARARKESTNSKLDADGKEIEPDEIGKEEVDGRAPEENVSSAKLSSARGNKKMNVKNRSSLKSLIKANMDSNRTPDSPSEKPSGDSKESNKNNSALT